MSRYFLFSFLAVWVPGVAAAQEADEDFEVPAKPAAAKPSPPAAPPASAAASAAAQATTPPQVAVPPIAESPKVATPPNAAAKTDTRPSTAEAPGIAEPTAAAVPGTAATTPPAPQGVAAPSTFLGDDLFGLGLRVTGYVQAQFEWNQASEDELQQGGAPLNFDRFVVRRARLRVERNWSNANVLVEIDGNTTRGPTFGLRRAEASVFLPGDSPTEPPLARLTAGLTSIPFGHELLQQNRYRVFAERSAASLAFFPGEPDVGVTVTGGRRFFRYALGMFNGEPFDDRPGRAPRELNRAKDLVAHLGFEAPAWGALQLSGGVSYLTGEGFHPGSGATKNAVQWRDLNENGTLDAGELSGVPGTAALPSANFPRWGMGIDVELALRTSLGLSRLYGELLVGSNLDRGLFLADPIATGQDKRELGGYVAALQELGRYALVGARVDVYNPNADFLTRQAGRLIPASQTITTISPVVGAVLPGRARLTVQYDFVRDSLARDVRGVPTDLRNDQLTVRLQGEL